MSTARLPARRTSSTQYRRTYTLLEAARDYWQSLPETAQAGFRFHHVSTDEVFGSLGDAGCFSETTAYQPNSPYAASKASSDHLVRAWHHTYGLPALITTAPTITDPASSRKNSSR